MDKRRFLVLATALILTLSACGQQHVSETLPSTQEPLHVPEMFTTIQKAIDEAEEGNVIIVSPGTYSENIDFKGKNVTLQSSDPNDPDIVVVTIIDGGGKSSVVTFQNAETKEAKLLGFTITNGAGNQLQIDDDTFVTVGGGILVQDDSAPIIEGNIIQGNYANYFGGGIYIWRSTPTIKGNTIYNNVAEKAGGGIYVSYSSSMIEENEITENRAIQGGGMYLMKSSPILRENTISRNVAQKAGGIFIRDSSPTIQGNTIRDNQAEVSGGGIYVNNTSTFRLGDRDDNFYQGNLPDDVYYEQ